MLEKRNLFLCKIRMICSLALYQFLYLVLFPGCCVYLTPMHLGLWQGSLRLQIFSVELHNKRWNMWSSFSRRRSWIKPGVFTRDITATVSWQYYKELVYTYFSHVSETFLRYHRYEKKKRNDRNKRNPRNDFAWFALRFGFGRFGAFARFVPMVSFCCFGF